MTWPHALVLDVDGTLVDSVYQHTVAWVRALRAHDLDIAHSTVHRAIGLGGDKLVAQVAGQQAEDAAGPAIRQRWETEFDSLRPQVRPLPGARQLLTAAADRGVPVFLSSSGRRVDIEHYVQLLGAEHAVVGWTTADDASHSKPDPELVEIALTRLGTRDAIMVGDTGWDVEAARRAGLRTATVLTGGWGSAELVEAGASVVAPNIGALRWMWDAPPGAPSAAGDGSAQQVVAVSAGRTP
ncbi:MAG: HAD family hydrolase [Actinomycetota bacterium]|nr:MAG: HAD family hydrolase [Actinomycetota bacterium]